MGKIRYVGDKIGKSAILKLALNQLILAQLSAFSVSLSLVETEGNTLDSTN
jgi:hypothetical protein